MRGLPAKLGLVILAIGLTFVFLRPRDETPHAADLPVFKGNIYAYARLDSALEKAGFRSEPPRAAESVIPSERNISNPPAIQIGGYRVEARGAGLFRRGLVARVTRLSDGKTETATLIKEDAGKIVSALTGGPMPELFEASKTDGHLFLNITGLRAAFDLKQFRFCKPVATNPGHLSYLYAGKDGTAVIQVAKLRLCGEGRGGDCPTGRFGWADGSDNRPVEGLRLWNLKEACR